MVPLIIFLSIATLWGIGAIQALSDRDPSLRKLNKWFRKVPNYHREIATGIYRGKYSSSNDYEEFRYVTDIKWQTMSYHRKLDAYEYTMNKLRKYQSSTSRRDYYGSYGSE